MIRHNWYLIIIFCKFGETSDPPHPTKKNTLWILSLPPLVKFGFIPLCGWWSPVHSISQNWQKRKEKKRKRPLDVSPLLLFLFLELLCSWETFVSESFKVHKNTNTKTELAGDVLSFSRSLSLAHAHAHTPPHTPNIDRRVDERFNTWCG